MANNPQSILLEALHSAGYAGALGQPLLAPEASLHKLNGEVLNEFVARNYTAGRIVLAASGCDHDELLQVAEPLLSDVGGGGPPTPPATEYVGGDWRQAADSPKTHIALAFEVPGGWRNEKDSFAVTVLQTLLDGGGSFSAGGPGKGMYSRLYSRVLNKYEQMQSFTAFNSIYNDTGIFSIHATSGSNFVPYLVDLATKEFIAVATPGDVTDAELQRAKNTTISAVLMNLESRVVVTEDIAVVDVGGCLRSRTEAHLHATHHGLVGRCSPSAAILPGCQSIFVKKTSSWFAGGSPENNTVSNVQYRCST